MLRFGANALAAFLMLAASAGGGIAAGGGHTGGNSGAHVSSAGMSNSNGPNSSDRDKGLARAEDRRSKEASLHSAGAHAWAYKALCPNGVLRTLWPSSR